MAVPADTTGGTGNGEATGVTGSAKAAAAVDPERGGEAAAVIGSATAAATGDRTDNRLDKDFLQNNIDRSIEYRKEYYKYSIGIATALLAFTVSFPSTLSKVDYSDLIFAAWTGLGVAVLGGVASHILWSNFFITWRNYDNKGRPSEGKAKRKPITTFRRLFDILQIVGLAVGVGGVVLFAGLNLGNIALKEKPIV
jgi:hypothetical protein